MNKKEWDRTELLSLISASSTLAGLCITVVAVMNSISKNDQAITIIDDIFALCAAGFLLCTYLIFWALRSKSDRTRLMLINVIDVLFLAAISSMTFAAFMMIYTIW
ncbi:MAG: hypothetical protein PHX60_06860 [Giesbergeria sp.]|uniref:hypothetical protein n=1 Tax=Giesbergeria sp. TaxID=2818473 RepID=UPI002603B512|nr:hypothetical protein [Giesbergeria sp.]MDD2609405.1 hypothetical protein [Giesbergeria sp.]